jgi:hypothetical protein
LELNRLAVTLAGAIALAVAAGGFAHAAPAPDTFAQHDDFTPQPNKIGPQPQPRQLRFDYAKSRWGLTVDMNQPVDRQMQWGDTRVGLNYRVAPGLRTGVGVMLGPEQTPDGRKLDSQGPTPRVRLETTLKF